MTDSKAIFITPKGEFGIYIESRRITARLTQRELGAAIKLPFQSLTALLTGKKPPTHQILERLTEVLGGENLVAKFPLLKQVDAKKMAQPKNVHLRLQYLVNELAGGKQGAFSLSVGWTKSAISPLINGKAPLTADKSEKLLKALPQVNREWLLTGSGQPFSGTTQADTESEQPAATGQEEYQEPESENPREKREQFLGPDFKEAMLRHIQLPGIPLATREMPVKVAPDLQVPASTVTQNQWGHTLDVTALIQFLEQLMLKKCGLTAAQTEELYFYFFPT
jgi:transcriptional regulator with XRE-family HTH domain